MDDQPLHSPAAEPFHEPAALERLKRFMPCGDVPVKTAQQLGVSAEMIARLAGAVPKRSTEADFARLGSQGASRP